VVNVSRDKEKKMREREKRQKVLIGGFCTRRTRCNLERDKERERERERKRERERERRSRDARGERLCSIPSSNPVSITPVHGKGKDNVRNGVLTSPLRHTIL